MIDVACPPHLICAGASTTLLSTNESIPESSLQVNAKHKGNMLYSLQKERKTGDMALQSERPLDSTDWKIIRELQQDSRLSSNELGRRVGLSAPATAERVRKLEDAGVITGYSAQIDPAKVGMPLLALIHLRCDQGSCLLRTSTVEEFPEVLEMHKLSGSHCAVLKVALSSMRHLEAFNHRLSAHGALVVHLVTSSVLPHRVIDWEQRDFDFDLPSYPGWSKP
jgi:Lrp/AsnC family transcriptional regulator, leucine-responsive regulatory protein